MKYPNLRFWFFDVLAMTTACFGLLALFVLGGLTLGLWVVGALFANHVIGAGACAWADDESASLLKWADEAPSMVLQAGITQAWPLILWLKRRERA